MNIGSHPKDAEERIKALIMKPDARDKQTRIGPSALGTQCEVCLANQMVNGTQGTFNVYAWLGTAVHEWLEKHEDNPAMLKETKVTVGEIGGYGTLKGSCDRYDPYAKMVIDFKTTSVKNAKTMTHGFVEKRDGTVEILEPRLMEYYVQSNAYALGLEKQGYEVDYIGMYVIPRDANHIRQHTLVPFAYNPDIVEAYLKRAGAIYNHGMKIGTKGLESHPECWTCRNE